MGHGEHVRLAIARNIAETTAVGDQIGARQTAGAIGIGHGAGNQRFLGAAQRGDHSGFLLGAARTDAGTPVEGEGSGKNQDNQQQDKRDAGLPLPLPDPLVLHGVDDLRLMMILPPPSRLSCSPVAG